jgi:glycosyltransferase involved in cell wall biosynthesis
MRTYVSEYQLGQPDALLWGLEGYQAALVLARHGRQPRALVSLRLTPRQTTLSGREIERAAQGQLIDIASAADDQRSPPISVVVCTRDRARALERCLAALARLEYPAFEVIVVDNASRDDATARVVAASPFRYVREPQPGLDWARNRGAADARYELIAYTDDDAVVDPGWLRGIAAAFADPQVMAVTGLVLPLELETPAQHLFERYGGMGKGLEPRLLQRDTLGAAGCIAAHAAGVGANMAFRRRVFATVGGFDTALDVGTPASGGGDLDMFHRVLAGGLTLRYEPSALIWHQHRRALADLRQQLYANGRSYGVYLLKTWRTGSVERRTVLHFGLRWLLGWVVARVVRALLRRERFPLGLCWAELRGALDAPAAYRATYQHDRRVRRRRPAYEAERISA